MPDNANIPEQAAFTEAADRVRQLEDRILQLEEENGRLKEIVNTLMLGYDTVCEGNFRTGEVDFMRLGIPLFRELGLEELPPWDEILPLYVRYGVYEEDRDEVAAFMNREYLLRHLEYGRSIMKEYRNQRGVYGEVKIIRTGEDTVLVGFAEMDRAITERKAQLYTDSLTKAKNRKYYDEALSPQPCRALVMTDIDSFKCINDTYGHLCGDAALRAAADALRSSVRGSDEVVRYGGDEFLIAFRQITLEALQRRTEQMRRAVEGIRMEAYPDLPLTISVGAVYGSGTVQDMIGEADKVLYESKKRKNTVTIREYTGPEAGPGTE